MSSEVGGEITYPFPNFNGCTVEVWEWISIYIPHFIMDGITYPCTTYPFSAEWQRQWVPQHTRKDKWTLGKILKQRCLEITNHRNAFFLFRGWRLIDLVVLSLILMRCFKAHVLLPYCLFWFETLAYTLIESSEWMDDIYKNIWDTITHPCHNCNSSLAIVSKFFSEHISHKPLIRLLIHVIIYDISMGPLT